MGLKLFQKTIVANFCHFFLSYIDQEDVPRLEISMLDLLLLQIINTEAYLCEPSKDLLFREMFLSRPLDLVSQCAAYLDQIN